MFVQTHTVHEILNNKPYGYVG